MLFWSFSKSSFLRLFSGLSDFKGDIYLDIESSRLKGLGILDSGEAISCFIFLNNGDGEGKTLVQHLILLFLRFKDRTNPLFRLPLNIPIACPAIIKCFN
jgi:hypothetical protein